MTFNDDGSTTIDFAESVVRIKPPTFGALKRLRAERVRLARQAEAEIAEWDAAHPAPEATDDEEVDPLAVQRHTEDRSLAAEEANLNGTIGWWKLLLVGDDTFKGLAEDPVPEDPDEWPAALLYDVRPVIPPNSSLDVILSSQSAPDRWVRHVANFRSRSGHTNGAGQPQTASL